MTQFNSLIPIQGNLVTEEHKDMISLNMQPSETDNSKNMLENVYEEQEDVEILEVMTNDGDGGYVSPQKLFEDVAGDGRSRSSSSAAISYEETSSSSNIKSVFQSLSSVEDGSTSSTLHTETLPGRASQTETSSETTSQSGTSSVEPSQPETSSEAISQSETSSDETDLNLGMDQ